ncbi:succinate dehydrogenase assembly factor 2 [Parahaliea sp. F7430]|uniref:FAD assembly factor SdhE n=1 Tax=Sediminihaliea albiluteola TaxID=2758564 RepID=A0A7W2TV60_9GAMM|nr:succinate dehydrogenase assembly factor 2 [Sediminihaliea albiluteola]MBA6412546.1 succinate dehydrogenase assembly factor 2 [Sediminihaliea albiluteola]
MIQQEEINRMRWASRRGMLELDLLLEPFVSSCYRELSARDRERYKRLMLCEDQEMFAWFMGREQPEDADIAAIVTQILEFSRAQSKT